MAATRIAKFNIQISASAESIRRTFSKLRADAQTFGQKFSANLTQVSFAFNNIAQAASTISAKIEELTGEIVELGQASARLQVGTTFLQELEFAAARVGAGFETVTDGLKDLSERLGEARATGAGPAIEALQTLGLTAEEVSPDLETAFRQIAEGLASIEDQSVKAFTAAELFGEAGNQMLEVFETGTLDRAAADLERMGGVLDEKAIQNVKEFDLAWNDLTATLSAMGRKTFSEFAPALQFLTNQAKTLLETIDRAQDLLSTGLTRSGIFGFGSTNAAAAQYGLRSSQERWEQAMLEASRQTAANTEDQFLIAGAGIE